MSQDLRLSGTKVLVVDEDDKARELLRRFLREWGADVEIAESGPRAIVALGRARAAGRPFSLVFAAAAMAVMDGIEFAGHLRGRPEEFARVVLIVNQHDLTRVLPRARAAGIAHHLVQPLVRPAVIAAVCAALNQGPGDPVVAAAAEVPHRRRRILLAEDVADISWLVRTMVEGDDYQVDLASDGEVAVDLFRLVGYDLVLMDLQMPGFDGYHATREIRKWERANAKRPTPIIAVTAFAREESPEKSRVAGFDGYLAKPFEKRALLGVIDRCLKSTQRRAQTAARPA